MAAVLVALAVSYAMTRHLAIMPLVTAVIVLMFGGLTLVLHDELFIKLKPTIIYILFGGTLVAGLAFGKPLLGMVFDSVFQLTRRGLAQADLAVGDILFCACDSERNCLAHADDGFLGELQTVRRGAADISVRRTTGSAAVTNTALESKPNARVFAQPSRFPARARAPDCRR